MSRQDSPMPVTSIRLPIPLKRRLRRAAARLSQQRGERVTWHQLIRETLTERVAVILDTPPPAA